MLLNYPHSMLLYFSLSLIGLKNMRFYYSIKFHYVDAFLEIMFEITRSGPELDYGIEVQPYGIFTCVFHMFIQGRVNV